MEHSEEKHDGSGTSEKTKPLDFHGLHDEKSEVSIRRARNGSGKFCVSGQACASEEESAATGQSGSRSRRSTRSRRGIFPNAFQSVLTRHRKDSGISKSSTCALDSRTGKPCDLNGSSSISCISHSTHGVSNALENGLALPPAKRRKSTPGCNDAQEPSTLCDDINIPRRPRCVPRRKNSSLDINGAPDLPNSIDRVSSGAHSSKLSSDLDTLIQPVGVLIGKRKKRNDEFKDNGPSGWDSVQHCKQENGSLVQVVKKRARRSHGNRQSTTTEKQKHLPSKPLTFADSDKLSDNCHDDDEESLEQNAARMLSSRFDPRCTGLSGDKVRFSSKSLSKSLSYVSVIQKGSNASESATSSLDIAGRVLRPRKQSEKSYVKKRRHFYEVCSTGVDPYWVLKRRIRVFWPVDQCWYFGLVKDYDPITKLHYVKYDDRDEEWTNLQNERFKLLLLPSEFSHKSDSVKMELEAKPGNEDGIASAVDDKCMDGLLESEPIISWLARSTHRIKASSIKVLKEKRVSRVNCLSHKNSRKPSISVMPKGSADEKDTEVALLKTRNHCDDRKFAFVYSRRRFRKNVRTVENKLEESSSWSFPRSVKLSAFSADGFEAHKETGGTSTALNPRKGTLRLLLPFHWISSLAWLFEDSWLYEIPSLHHDGKLMLVWPSVCMEIVFLDNKMGLRFLSFKGYLQHVVAVLCLFIKVFYQPKRSTSFAELQLPFTSIGFRLSCLQGEGRRLLFYVYNFLDLKSSRWHYLGRKLKHLAVTMKELPLSACTYPNVKNLLCSGEKSPLASNCWESFTLESLRNMSWKKFIHYLDPEISADSHISLPYFRLNGQKKSCPFSLPFCTVPALFLFLHFKMLMENNAASMSSKIPDTLPLLDCHPENYGKFMDECNSPVEDSSDQFSETTHENLGPTLNQDLVGSRWLPCPHSKLETDALSISNDGDWMTSCNISLTNDLNLNGKSAVHKELGENGCGETDSRFHKHPCTKSLQDVGNPSSPLLEDISSTEESEGGCGPFLNTANVKIQSNPLEVKMSDKGVCASGKSASYLTWNTNGCTIHSPNATAPRTIWHRNRQSLVSPSVGHHSKLWPEDWDRFVNGYKKPRTQVSYVLPFGGYDMRSKSRSHHRKGRPHRRLKIDSARNMFVGSKSVDNRLDSLTCDANVLVTGGDRGWRAYGARVALESDHQKDWQIAVKLSGVTKYSHKAQQFLQPGTTNRYTHAMMWKGGKDWTLEFTDRSQWSLFKEMYEECYNRNVRAASVKNIPIPGVCLIEDCDDCATEVPFVFSSLKYFRQKGTEVDMALDPSHVLYDMDSEDEEWISKLRNSADDSGRIVQGISEEMFEKAMDMFEKAAFTQHCNEFTDADIGSFLAEVGHMEVIKAVHEHWRQKRQKKGMPLIRQFQPPLWKRYQQQLKEWESTMSKMHNSSSGCQDKTTFLEKPPMFAFCLRPRGLEVPNKGSKQRSHKKLPVNGHHSNIARENYSLQGKKLNGYLLGKEKVSATVPSCEFSYVTTWAQSPTGVSPRDPVSGFTAFDNGSSDRNYHWRPDRNNLKKMGMSVPPGMSVSPRDHPKTSTFAQRTKGNGTYRPNSGFPERFNTMQHKSDGFHRHQADVDEFMLRDASSAAQHALNMAKLKREKAQWLMHKADLAIHKAAVALTTADAIKAFEEDIMTGDG